MYGERIYRRRLASAPNEEMFGRSGCRWSFVRQQYPNSPLYPLVFCGNLNCHPYTIPSAISISTRYCLQVCNHSTSPCYMWGLIFYNSNLLLSLRGGVWAHHFHWNVWRVSWVFVASRKTSGRSFRRHCVAPRWSMPYFSKSGSDLFGILAKRKWYVKLQYLVTPEGNTINSHPWPFVCSL
jgi:hypothetical protein